MEETNIIWKNGEWVPWKEANVHVLTHALHYGGGAFEGIRVYETEKGPAIFRLEDHIKRLFYSAEVLKMEIPYSQEEIISVIIELIRKNGLQKGYIRPLIFYGYGKMGVNPVGCPVDCIIACWPWGAYLSHDRVDIKTSHYIRIHPKSTVIDAKLCGHYVNSILASLELRGTHYHEALLLDSEHFICEGVGENFFMVKKGTLYTPPLGEILNGITRNTVIALSDELGLTVIEKRIKSAEAYEADEAFFTGTAAEIAPIRSIDDHVLKHGEESPITLKVKQAYLDVVHGRDPAFLKYLTRVN